MSVELETPARETRGKRIIKPPKLRPDIDHTPDGNAFLGNAATCGNDLLGMWELPAEALTHARLKVTRQIYGTKQYELVSDEAVKDYNLAEVAREHGPGEYLMILNPGPRGSWPRRNTKVIVSADYARKAGFDPYPVQEPPRIAPPAPRFSEIRSVQESGRALEQGQTLTPAMLGQLLETLGDRIAARVAPPAPVVNPMENMMVMFKFFQEMNQNSVTQALTLAGLKNPAPVPEGPEETNWLEVVKELAPAALEIAKGIFHRPAPVETPAAPREVNPEAQPQEAPEPMRQEIPMTKEEASPFAGAVAMLRPFSGIMVRMLDRVERGEQCAEEMARFIPEALEGQVIDLARYAAERGPGVLAIIDPALATPKAAACMQAIAEILKGEL